MKRKLLACFFGACTASGLDSRPCERDQAAGHTNAVATLSGGETDQAGRGKESQAAAVCRSAEHCNNAANKGIANSLRRTDPRGGSNLSLTTHQREQLAPDPHLLQHAQQSEHSLAGQDQQLNEHGADRCIWSSCSCNIAKTPVAADSPPVGADGGVPTQSSGAILSPRLCYPDAASELRYFRTTSELNRCLAPARGKPLILLVGTSCQASAQQAPASGGAALSPLWINATAQRLLAAQHRPGSHCREQDQPQSRPQQVAAAAWLDSCSCGCQEARGDRAHDAEPEDDPQAAAGTRRQAASLAACLQQDPQLLQLLHSQHQALLEGRCHHLMCSQALAPPAAEVLSACHQYSTGAAAPEARPAPEASPATRPVWHAHITCVAIAASAAGVPGADRCHSLPALLLELACHDPTPDAEGAGTRSVGDASAMTDERLMLQGAPDITTLCSLSGAVLHQNESSRIYMGRRCSREGGASPGAGASSSCILTGSEFNLLSRLFALEPAALQGMLDALSGRGASSELEAGTGAGAAVAAAAAGEGPWQAGGAALARWQGVVHVPASLVDDSSIGSPGQPEAAHLPLPDGGPAAAAAGQRPPALCARSTMCAPRLPPGLDWARAGMATAAAGTTARAAAAEPNAGAAFAGSAGSSSLLQQGQPPLQQEQRQQQQHQQSYSMQDSQCMLATSVFGDLVVDQGLATLNLKSPLSTCSAQGLAEAAAPPPANGRTISRGHACSALTTSSTDGAGSLPATRSTLLAAHSSPLQQGSSAQKQQPAPPPILPLPCRRVATTADRPRKSMSRMSLAQPMSHNHHGFCLLLEQQLQDGSDNPKLSGGLLHHAPPPAAARICSATSHCSSGGAARRGARAPPCRASMDERMMLPAAAASRLDGFMADAAPPRPQTEAQAQLGQAHNPRSCTRQHSGARRCPSRVLSFMTKNSMLPCVVDTSGPLSGYSTAVSQLALGTMWQANAWPASEAGTRFSLSQVQGHCQRPSHSMSYGGMSHHQADLRLTFDAAAAAASGLAAGPHGDPGCAGGGAAPAEAAQAVRPMDPRVAGRLAGRASAPAAAPQASLGDPRVCDAEELLCELMKAGDALEGGVRQPQQVPAARRGLMAPEVPSPCGSPLLRRCTDARVGQQPACRWHLIRAVRLFNPRLGQDVLLLVQTDITSIVEMERRLAAMLEAEHQLLEGIFPSHVLQHAVSIGVHSPGLQQGHLTHTASASAAAARPVSGPAAAVAVAAAARGSLTAAKAPAAFSSPAPAVHTACGQVARHHQSVTVMFADVVGFTPMCASVPAEAVMAFLNELFSRFDSLLDIYGVYKVETIGDCYMVAGGLTRRDSDGTVEVRSGDEDTLHAVKVVSFARAMLREAAAMALPSGEPLRLRVGVHSGPVTSGVVGTRMPRFCLFGDTVNTASRMESTCEPCCIHASATTRELVPQEPWQRVSGMEVKGKGLMDTYVLRPEDAVLRPLAPRLVDGPRHSCSTSDLLLLLSGSSAPASEAQLL